MTELYKNSNNSNYKKNSCRTRSSIVKQLDIVINPSAILLPILNFLTNKRRVRRSKMGFSSSEDFLVFMVLFVCSFCLLPRVIFALDVDGSASKCQKDDKPGTVCYIEPKDLTPSQISYAKEEVKCKKRLFGKHVEISIEVLHRRSQEKNRDSNRR